MTIKIGSVYNVIFKSGNTHTAFSWPDKIPDSGNKYMKNKVIKITKKLNPKNSLDYDYVGDIYDKNDDAIELKNRPKYNADRKIEIFKKLNQATCFETFLKTL